jgi:hypothetical protein
MRSLTLLACLSLSSLAGCGTPSDGYYDANGNWIAYNRYNQEAHAHSPLPGGTQPPTDDSAVTTTVTTYTYSYDRPGYYDYKGYYVSASNPNVPLDMFPPRGMCRVWFPDRDVDDQPAVESCNNIKTRVPVGSYVIYGG